MVLRSFLHVLCFPNLSPNYLSPKFSALPQILPFDFGEETVDSGDPASVTCTVLKGDFPVDIAWLHNNKTITTNTNGVSILRGKKLSMLSIEMVNFEHAGQYTCIVKNLAGSTTYSATLNVNGTLVCFFVTKPPALPLNNPFDFIPF